MSGWRKSVEETNITDGADSFGHPPRITFRCLNGDRA
jgi:hypothetical protein